MNRYCPECLEEKKINTPSDKVPIENGICPDCGTELENCLEKEDY